jgi:hypothetical protein
VPWASSTMPSDVLNVRTCAMLPKVRRRRLPVSSSLIHNDPEKGINTKHRKHCSHTQDSAVELALIIRENKILKSLLVLLWKYAGRSLYEWSRERVCCSSVILDAKVVRLFCLLTRMPKVSWIQEMKAVEWDYAAHCESSEVINWKHLPPDSMKHSFQLCVYISVMYLCA